MSVPLARSGSPLAPARKRVKPSVPGGVLQGEGTVLVFRTATIAGKVVPCKNAELSVRHVATWGARAAEEPAALDHFAALVPAGIAGNRVNDAGGRLHGLDAKEVMTALDGPQAASSDDLAGVFEPWAKLELVERRLFSEAEPTVSDDARAFFKLGGPPKLFFSWHPTMNDLIVVAADWEATIGRLKFGLPAKLESGHIRAIAAAMPELIAAARVSGPCALGARR